MRAWSDFWSRFSGEKPGSCARSMDVIPAFQLEWEMLQTLPGEQLGLMAMPVPPLCAQKTPSTSTQSSSWLRGRQASALGPAKPRFMELFIWFYGYQQLCVPRPVCSQRGSDLQRKFFLTE